MCEPRPHPPASQVMYRQGRRFGGDRHFGRLGPIYGVHVPARAQRSLELEEQSVVVVVVVGVV